jgi:hypothetical protein
MNQQVLMCVIINAGNKKRTDEYTECMNEVLDVTSPDYRKYGF